MAPKKREQKSSSQTSPKVIFFKAHLQGFAVAGSFGGLDVCRDTGNSVDCSLLFATLYLGSSKAGIDRMTGSVGWMDWLIGPMKPARFPSQQEMTIEANPQTGSPVNVSCEMDVVTVDTQVLFFRGVPFRRSDLFRWRFLGELSFLTRET